jgi:hypothetical protein
MKFGFSMKFYPEKPTSYAIITLKIRCSKQVQKWDILSHLFPERGVFPERVKSFVHIYIGSE